MNDKILTHLTQVLAERREADASTSYVARLYQQGVDAILKKIGEEATEVILAAKSGDKDKIIHEVADLWFHTLVMLSHVDLTFEDVLSELSRREGLSGIVEKEKRHHPDVTRRDIKES